jgi:hypothetical protein
MRKIKFLSIFLVLGLVLVLSGCKKPITLDKPTIALNETTVSWEAIANAKAYAIKVNDTEYNVTATSYDLKDIKADSYSIKLKAVGDGKDYLDSEYSNEIKVTPTNKVIVSQGTVSTETVTYKVMVQSNKDVLGFTIDLTYPKDKLVITNNNVVWTELLPEAWVYDVYLVDNHIKIAVTGLDAINVRLEQILIELTFTGTTVETITVASYTIDN